MGKKINLDKEKEGSPLCSLHVLPRARVHPPPGMVKEGHDSTVRPKLETYVYCQQRKEWLFDRWAGDGKAGFGRGALRKLEVLKVLGTPNEESWPTMADLPEYKSDFPHYDPVPLASIAPKLCADGLDLLTQMLRYEPAQRVSAKAAMSHPYFKELDQTRFKAA